jgi:hypothetical protein
MERLRQSKDDEERAYMAQALGELLAVDRPTTLNPPHGRVQLHRPATTTFPPPPGRLGNGFLYNYLIASFGDQW